MQKAQVRIYKSKRTGRNKAAYRTYFEHANCWDRQWHHLTVADARKAQRTGKLEMIVGQFMTVVD